MRLPHLYFMLPNKWYQIIIHPHPLSHLERVIIEKDGWMTNDERENISGRLDSSDDWTYLGI
jgi:hypothetical protein